jgi:hypothetical protein
VLLILAISPARLDLCRARLHLKSLLCVKCRRVNATFFERPSAERQRVVGDRVIDERDWLAFERVRRRWRRFTLIVIYSVKFYTTQLPHTVTDDAFVLFISFCHLFVVLDEFKFTHGLDFVSFVSADSILFKSHSCNFKNRAEAKIQLWTVFDTR